MTIRKVGSLQALLACPMQKARRTLSDLSRPVLSSGSPANTAKNRTELLSPLLTKSRCLLKTVYDQDPPEQLEQSSPQSHSITPSPNRATAPQDVFRLQYLPVSRSVLLPCPDVDDLHPVLSARPVCLTLRVSQSIQSTDLIDLLIRSRTSRNLRTPLSFPFFHSPAAMNTPI